MIDGLQRKRLGDICQIRLGETWNPDYKEGGHIPVIGYCKEPIAHQSKYNVEENTITICRKGGNIGHVSMLETKSFVSDSRFYLMQISSDISRDYLYYYLRTVQDKIANLSNKSLVDNRIHQS